MSEGTKITLSRALRLKNRLVNRMTQVWTDIATYNSRPSEADPVVRVDQLYPLYAKLQSLLIELKTAIQTGTQKIQGQLVTLSEKKGFIKLLKALSTTSGKQVGQHARYGSSTTEPLTYIAVITKGDVDTTIGQLEKEIDTLQDQVEQHNASTQVTISNELLADGVLTAPSKKK